MKWNPGKSVVFWRRTYRHCSVHVGFDDVPRPSARGLLGNNAISGKNWVLATSLDEELARSPARKSKKISNWRNRCLSIGPSIREIFFNSYDETSSETQGQSVGSGEKAGRKFSSTGERAPGYRLSPSYFQNFKRMPAPDWAQKMLCIIVSNRRTVAPKFFSWVYTRLLLFRSQIVGLMHQRNARSQETFSLIENPHLISKYCLPEN